MADSNGAKKKSKQASSDTPAKVTKVKIPANLKKVDASTTAPRKQPEAADVSDSRRKPNPKAVVAAPAGYFVGAWREIRQVRWPNRRSTWSLTFAVLVFSVFWALVILGLDLLFDTLFRNVIL